MAKNCCSFCCGLLVPSPQQSSEQEHAPSMTDLNNFVEKFNDISQIEGLIQLLEELLNMASGEKSDDGRSNSAAGSHIHDGQIILEMLDERIGKRPVKKKSSDGPIGEIEKVCIEVLKGSEKIPQVGIALCMLGSVLERFIQMSDNKSECLDVLRRMLNLGKQIVQLNEQIPDQKEKLNEGIQCIVVGTTMCISQLARANIFMSVYFFGSVNIRCCKLDRGRDLVVTQANFAYLDFLNRKLNYANFFSVLLYVTQELKAKVSAFGHLWILYSPDTHYVTPQ